MSRASLPSPLEQRPERATFVFPKPVRSAVSLRFTAFHFVSVHGRVEDIRKIVENSVVLAKARAGCSDAVLLKVCRVAA